MPPWTLQIGTEGPGWCSLALPCPCPQLPSRRVRCAALLSRKLHPLLRQSRCCLSLLGFIPKRVLMQRLHLYPTFSPSFVFLYSSGIVGGPALWGGGYVGRGETLGTTVKASVGGGQHAALHCCSCSFGHFVNCFFKTLVPSKCGPFRISRTLRNVFEGLTVGLHSNYGGRSP